MNRAFFLELAGSGLRMPIGTDLALHEHQDHEAIRRDGRRLGEVLASAAATYRTPLAVPLMDLTLEKSALLGLLGISDADAATYHFHAIDDGIMSQVRQRLALPLDARSQAHMDSVRYIATNTRLLPIGMSIGPFSLMTKLLADPITPVYMAGEGTTAAEDDDVRNVERALELAGLIIERSIKAQLAAGAKAIFIAEPAANVAYLSPKQMAAGGTVWARYVMAPNRRVRDQIRAAGAELIFHCCGELIDPMVQGFAALDPALLSLGASRELWRDAVHVGPQTVLYGNLPSKKFYSDSLTTEASVQAMARDLLEKMTATRHPFILGSECDVLSVPGSEATIKRKIAAMLSA